MFFFCQVNVVMNDALRCNDIENSVLCYKCVIPNECFYGMRKMVIKLKTSKCTINESFIAEKRNNINNRNRSIT